MILRSHRAVWDLYGAIGVKAGVNSISLFDLTATISSSRGRAVFIGSTAPAISRNGIYGISGAEDELPYSGLMLAARITLAR